MQLNSKSTHAIIVIDAINNERVLFQKYANDLRNGSNIIESVVFSIDKGHATGTKTIADFELQKAYEHLASLPEFSDYELATGKNWKFVSNNIRLTVDKKKLTSHIITQDEAGKLISIVLNDSNIKQYIIDNETEEFIYIYLKFIYDMPAPLNHYGIISNTDFISIDLQRETMHIESINGQCIAVD